MSDVGDLPVLTFGNFVTCVLKTGVIKWPLKLCVAYIFNVVLFTGQTNVTCLRWCE